MLHSNDRHPKWQKLGVSSYLASLPQRGKAGAEARSTEEMNL